MLDECERLSSLDFVGSVPLLKFLSLRNCQSLTDRSLLPLRTLRRLEWVITCGCKGIRDPPIWIGGGTIIWFAFPPPLGIFAVGWKDIPPAQRGVLLQIGYTRKTWENTRVHDPYQVENMPGLIRRDPQGKLLPESFSLISALDRKRWPALGLSMANWSEWPLLKWPRILCEPNIK